MQGPSDKAPPAGWIHGRAADYLSNHPAVGRPVTDRSGLSGLFSFSLDFAFSDAEDRPNVFSAVQQQLGLKLQASKAPLEVLTIDRLEKPPETNYAGFAFRKTSAR